MKTFNPITPSNRHRILTFKNILSNVYYIEKIKKLSKNYNISKSIKQSFLQGRIIQNNKNIIEIDAGLQSNIQISEKELNQINNINHSSLQTGDKVSLFIYKTEYLKGDQLLNNSLLYNKLYQKKLDYYHEYKLLKILSNNNIRKNFVRGIVLGYFKYGIRIGIGGKIYLFLDNNIKNLDLNEDSFFYYMRSRYLYTLVLRYQSKHFYKKKYNKQADPNLLNKIKKNLTRKTKNKKTTKKIINIIHKSIENKKNKSSININNINNTIKKPVIENKINNSELITLDPRDSKRYNRDLLALVKTLFKKTSLNTIDNLIINPKK
jgi:hypothetical protein